MQLSLVDLFRGNWESALLHAQESFRLEVESSILGSGVGTLFRQVAYAAIAPARSQSLIRSASGYQVAANRIPAVRGGCSRS